MGSNASLYHGSRTSTPETLPRMQEMGMYEQYVLGMLTNFDAGLPLDRIHNMLKMFVPGQGYDKSSDQLADFLKHLVNEEKLAVSGGLYLKR